MARATLFDPVTKARVAVDVGGQQANDLFAKGYKLETPEQNTNTYSTSAPKQIQSSGRDLFAVDSSAGTSTKIGNPSSISSFLDKGYQDTRRSFGSGTGSDTSGLDSSKPVTDPNDSFKAAIAALLQRAQTGNTGNDDLMKQRNALINARFNAVNDVTPENLRVLSPDQQAALKSGNASGLTDQLGGVNAAIQSRDAAAKQASQDLKDAMAVLDEQRKAASDDLAEQNRVRDDARATIKTLWDNFGSQAFANMSPEDRSHYEKIAEFPHGTLDIASDTLAQQKLAQGNYKYVAPTKYGSGGSFDPKTGILTTPAGGTVKPGVAISSSNKPSARDTSDPALAAYMEATQKLPPVNEKQRQDLRDFYYSSQIMSGKDINPWDAARGQVVAEKQTLKDAGLSGGGRSL